jgi:hypothetical protein
MTIEKLVSAGYKKIGEVEGMLLYAKFFESGRGFIMQFNLAKQEEAIGTIYVTKEILKELIK